MSLSSGQLYSPDVNHCVIIKFWPVGHRESFRGVHSKRLNLHQNCFPEVCNKSTIMKCAWLGKHILIINQSNIFSYIHCTLKYDFEQYHPIFSFLTHLKLAPVNHVRLAHNIYPIWFFDILQKHLLVISQDFG